MAEPTPEELEVLKDWLEKYKASESYCTDFFEKGRENYKLYKNYQDSGEKVYKHSIFVPYSFAYTEDAAAYFMLSIMASPQLYSLLPRFNAVPTELCFELEQVITWAVTDIRAEFALEIEELIKNINIYNVGYTIGYPVLDGDKKLERLFFDTPSTLDIYTEPRVKRLSRMNWVIKKSFDSWENLKKLEDKKIYKNVEQAKGGFTEESAVTKLLNDIGISTGQPYTDKTGLHPEILDCLQDGHVVTIAGRKAIIQDTTKRATKPFHPFKWPMLDCRFEGAPGETFGVGKIESIKPTQIEMNLLRSQRRDNVSLLLNKLFFYDMLAGEIDLTTLFSAPGNVIVGSGREALDTLDIPDITMSSFQESDELKFDMQNITSMWDYSRGGTPRRKETATGIIRLQQAAQARNEWLLRKLDLYVLAPTCLKILVYLKEHMPREMYNKIVGPKNLGDMFFGMKLGDIVNSFQILPITESISSIKEIDVNQFLMAFDRMIQYPDVNRVALMKQLLLKIGEKNYKEILPMLSKQGQEFVNEEMDRMGGPQGILGRGPGGLNLPTE